jgi:hypothetical protein
MGEQRPADGTCVSMLLLPVQDTLANFYFLQTGVAVARRTGILQIIEPATSRIVWQRIDGRVDADDMFVALQETDGHLFWCTNAGCFGFAPFALDIELDPSAAVVRLDGSSDTVWNLV